MSALYGRVCRTMSIGERGRIHSSVTETCGPWAPGPRQNGQRGEFKWGRGTPGDQCGRRRLRALRRDRAGPARRASSAGAGPGRWSWNTARPGRPRRGSWARTRSVSAQLVAAESDRRELRSLRCDSIPVERTHAVIAEALARDPDLRVADIAGWLDMHQADFERAFLGKGRGRARQAARHCYEGECADDRARTCAERARRLLAPRLRGHRHGVALRRKRETGRGGSSPDRDGYAHAGFGPLRLTHQQGFCASWDRLRTGDRRSRRRAGPIVVNRAREQVPVPIPG